MEWHKGEYTISTDKARIDVQVVHQYLCNDSYWATGVPVDVVIKSIDNSLCFGVYHGDEQVGLARVISDFAVFAYLADVFILPEHRGKGLSKWLMQEIINHPQLQGLRRFILTTKDAHGLYAQFGFIPYHQPERLMTRNDPDVYMKKK